jgi:peptide/nickel transport system ATP-binding protein
LAEQVTKKSVLSVKNFSIDYLAERGYVHAVRDVSFDLYEGEALGLIGESGCGKSSLGLGLLRLLPKNGYILQPSEILFQENGSTLDVLTLDKEALRQYRWNKCAMVFQAALNAFNPVLRISAQIYDTAKAHGLTDKDEVKRRMLNMFELVRLEPNRVFNAYPHELSGGMRQRVLLALGLLLNPPIIILDEPTTALDILTQRTILNVLKDLREKITFSMIFISHDLSIAAELADRVATMYAGTLVEVGPVYDMFYRPLHPYTYGLIHAMPKLAEEDEELISIPGSPPDLIEPPPGCKFHPRCPYMTEECTFEEPQLEEHAPGHVVACYHIDEVIADHDAQAFAEGGQA